MKIALIAANLTSGNYQTYAHEGPGQRILQGLLKGVKADHFVVMLQEAKTDAEHRRENDALFGQWVRSVFGEHATFARTDGDELPNAVISSLPIVDSEEIDDTVASNRDHAFAVVDLPGPRDLGVVSMHLLTRDAESRQRQADELMRAVRQRMAQRQELVWALGGDTNVVIREEPATQSMAEAVDVEPPFPVDEQGREGTNARATSPYDVVFVSRELEAHEIPVQLGNRNFPAGYVADVSESKLLSELSPALASDGTALNMQHKAVVRVFEIPDDGVA